MVTPSELEICCDVELIQWCFYMVLIRFSF